jgi:uncharacterized radical SAM superfamily Fe-S cluster-containing enzyme
VCYSQNMSVMIEKTESICPQCKRVIAANIIDENGSAYMTKKCPEHGLFKAMVSKYSWYYQGLNSLYDKLFPLGHALNAKTIRSVIFYPTKKCNLHCPICYTHAHGADGDESLDEIKKMADSIKGRKIINILGGEPTVRQDICQIISIFKQAGHYVEFYTNGIAIKDINYLKRLKESGIGIVQISVDSLSDETVYQQMRERSLLKDKLTALGNLKKLNIKTGIIDVIVRGVNEQYISEIIDFTKQNINVQEISMRGYSHIGKLGLSVKEEFTMDELVEIFQRQTNGMVTLEEFYMFQKIIYILRHIFDDISQCYVNQHIFVPRCGSKMRDIFPPDKFNKYLNEFEDIFQYDKGKAKAFIIKKIFSRVFQYPQFCLQRILKKSRFNHYAKYYLELEFAMFYTPYTLDLNKTKKRCADAWLPSYANGKFEDYCGVLSLTTPV